MAADQVPERSDAQREPDHSLSPSPKAARERAGPIPAETSSADVESIADAVVIKDGEPFFLCPPDGLIPILRGHGYGLYHHDTRFLSGYELTMNRTHLGPLAAVAVSSDTALLELANRAIELDDGRSIAKERLAVRWTRELDGDRPELHDRIAIHNYSAETANLTLQLAFAAEFEDVFEIRGMMAQRRGLLHDPRWDGDRLGFRYDGQDGVVRTLTVSFDPAPARHDGASCEVDIDVASRGKEVIAIRLKIGEEIEPGAKPIERRTAKGPRPKGANASARADTTEGGWAGGPGWTASVRSDSLSLDAVLGRSLDDLSTLRAELDGRDYYAAGVPWFSTLFGRDSLIAACQTLAFEPRVAAETLRLLARRQGTKVDEWRHEQPGKILHELRIGELARLHEIPHTPYYGSIDSTPLFLIVLARHATWTGSLDLFRELRDSVDRALDWIGRFGDPTGDGYVAYPSTAKKGLINQGWKDSGDGIVTADGEIAESPIALAEVQGYVYAAKREIATLYEREGDAERAERLRSEADELQARFERDFWSDELGCYILARQAGGKPCAVATSNAGQVLWSGIASPEHAHAVAERLMREDMFSGWGVRTLSADALAHNPIGYHLGTIWPHDNSLIAEGFRRYGLDEAADRILRGLVEAATDFPQQRLPECFAGYPRATFGVPVRYPVACHPQAWAAGAIPHLIVSNLGLVADGFERRLRIDRPRLPSFVEHLELRRLPVADAHVDLVFERVDGRT
ncbi:MAG: hypothetical protein M3Y88_01175, partial [Chloroflexota bacterium]|nr:hypothetical protein [Chloroflexota bacterium]